MKFRLNTTNGFAFFKFVRFIFVAIAIISIFSSGYAVWQQSHSISPLIEAVGGKLFNPLYNLAEHLKSVSTSGLWINTGHLFKDVGSFFTNIYLFIEPIFFLYYVVYYLFIFSKNAIIMDTSRNTQSFIVSVILYFAIVLVYLSAFTSLPLDTPFIAIRDIFISIFSLF